MKMRPRRSALAMRVRKRFGAPAASVSATCLGEGFDLAPLVPPLDRDDHVQALAAGGLDEADEPELGERAAHVARRCDHLGEAEALARIEVEDDAVRPLGPVDARAPGMHLQDAHLHQGDEPFGVLDEEIGAGLLEAGDRHLPELGRHARAGMALVEALLLPAGRTAHRVMGRWPACGRMWSATAR